MIPNILAKRAGRSASYSDAYCPDGVNTCSSATAWASCCGDIVGSYTIDPTIAYRYLRNAGFTAVQSYSMLYLMNRESSFTPDVIAHCPPCCCTEAGVDAVGLLQIVVQAWPQYSIDWLKDPQNNCYAAAHVFAQQGWGAWAPLNAALDDSTIAYWESVVSGSGGAGYEPGTSLASDINAAPQAGVAPSLIAPGQQPVVTPPTPQITVNLIDNPAQYSEARSGWDAVTWHYTNDVPYYSGYDAEIVRRLSTLTGG